MKSLSKYFQVLLLLTFLLPFFPKGCGSSAKELDICRNNDSIQISQHSETNTGVKDTISAYKQIPLKPGNDVEQESITVNSSEYTRKLSKYPIFKIILRPSDNYSGVGFFIDWFLPYVFWFGSITTFLFWFLSLIIKLKDFNNIFHLINLVGLVNLFITSPILNLNATPKLWGYWVSLVFGTLILLFDTFLLIRQKNKQKIEVKRN